MKAISWDRLAAAVRHYTESGFRYVEVPWIVSPDAVAVTLPEGHLPFGTRGGGLIGSGEQAFIHMRNDLKPGDRLVCVTPCFRDDQPDELHQRQFMKCELIHVLEPGGDGDRELHDLLNHASDFHQECVRAAGKSSPVYQQQTNDGWDIEIENVEVGSYGVRSITRRGKPVFTWVYGTGCAEPRLSQAIEMLKPKV